MNLVFDSCALIAYLHNENGADVTESLLQDNSNICYVHSINLCEVYYEARRRGGEDTAQIAISALRQAGIQSREDMDDEIWQSAGQIKADFRRVSLADCFCVALGNRLDAEVITADRHEMEALANAKVCKINFIR